MRQDRADPELMALVKQKPLDLEAVEARVAKLCENDLTAGGQIPRIYPDAFELIEKVALTRQDIDHNVVVRLTKLLLTLCRRMAKVQEAEPYERFKSAYHIVPAITKAPDVLEDEANRSFVEERMREAFDLGVRLLVGDLAEEFKERGIRNEPAATVSRVQKLAAALRAHGLNEEPDLDGKLAACEAVAATHPGNSSSLHLAQVCRERIEHLAGESPLDITSLHGCVSELAGLLVNALSPFEVWNVRRECASALKKIKDLRKPLGKQNQRETLEEVNSMLYTLALALFNKPPSITEVHPHEDHYGQFLDGYEVYDAVRESTLIETNEAVLDQLRRIIQETIGHGESVLFHSEKQAPERLLQFKKNPGYTLSRLGELCRACAVFGAVAPWQLSDVLQRGVQYFLKALDVGKDDSDQAFALPRLAECHARLGDHRSSVESLKRLLKIPLVTQDNDKLWTTYWTLSRNYSASALQSGNQRDWENSLKFACLAGRVWEPSDEFLQGPSAFPRNKLIHTQLAWIYLHMEKFEESEAQAAFFSLVCQDSKEASDSSQYDSRTAIVRARALIGSRRQAEAEIVLRDVLSRSMAEKYRIQPLLLLASVIRTRQPESEELAQIGVHLRSACDAAGQAFRCVTRLNDQQLTGLIDDSAFRDCIKQAHLQLRSGRVTRVLVEFPPMVSAAQLLLGENAPQLPELLLLLGVADRDAGRMDDSIKTFRHIATIDLSRRFQARVWEQLGMTYEKASMFNDALESWNRSYANLQRPVALAGRLRMSRKLIQLAKVAATLPLQSPKILTSFPVVQEIAGTLGDAADAVLLIDLLRTTDSLEYVELIARALRNATAMPAGLLQVSLERAPHYVGRDSRYLGHFMTLAVRCLACAYYHDGTSFRPMASEVLRRIFLLDANPKREMLFHLLTQGRDAAIWGVVRQYHQAAIETMDEVLDPSLIVGEGGVAEDNPLTFSLASLVRFLRTPVPASMIPPGHRHCDLRSVRADAAQLLAMLATRMQRDIARGCSFITSEVPTEMTCPWFDWMRLRLVIESLLDWQDGPLTNLAFSSGIWSVLVDVGSKSLSVRFISEDTDPVLWHEECRSIGGWLKKSDAKLSLAIEEQLPYSLTFTAEWSGSNHLAAEFASLSHLEERLRDESLRLLNDGKPDKRFYTEALSLMPESSDLTYRSEALWIDYLQRRFDDDFATAAEWLVHNTGPNHPRSLLHDLKNKLRNCVGLPGGPAREKAINELREEAAKSQPRMWMVLNRRGDNAEVACDFDSIARSAAQQFKFRHSDIRLDIHCLADHLVPLPASSALRVINNLLQNAFVAQEGIVGDDRWIELSVVDDTEANQEPVVLVTARNPFLRGKEDRFSTGIGHVWLRSIAREFRGDFRSCRADQVNSDDEANVWIATLKLPALAS